MKQRNTVQNTRNLYAWNPECDGNCQALISQIIHVGQALDPATSSQWIHNEIHRPDQIRFVRMQKRKPFDRQSFTALSTFYAQSVKVVNALYPLVIDVKALRTE